MHSPTCPMPWGECEHPTLQSRLGIRRHSTSPKHKWQIPDAQLRGEARQGGGGGLGASAGGCVLPARAFQGQPSKCRVTVSTIVYERAARRQRHAALHGNRPRGVRTLPCSLCEPHIPAPKPVLPLGEGMAARVLQPQAPEQDWWALPWPWLREGPHSPAPTSLGSESGPGQVL